MEESIEIKLKSLLQLQLMDSKVDKIHSIRGELPMEVKDLEDEIVGLETREEKLSKDLKELEKSIKSQEEVMVKAKELIVKYESQQLNVKNNREYLALTKELELQKLEIMAAEKKIKDFKNQIVEKEDIIEKSKEELDDRKKHLGAKKQELQKIVDETEKEEKEIAKIRNDMSKKVEERLIKAYERIRKSVFNGLAVVTIERDSCGGCYSKVPPQRQMDIRQRKKIIVCENCGRILVDQDISEEVKENMSVKVD